VHDDAERRRHRDARGVTSFAALQDALSKGGSADLVYFVFDLLHLDGLDLRPLPLIERKGTLKKLLGRRGKAGQIRYSDHIQGRYALRRRSTTH
jgi:bifunctional non-homologous end joining protein LigD